MCIKLVTNKVENYTFYRLCNLIFLFFLFFLSNKVIAQQDYTIEYLNTDNGLPTNAMKGLIFDPDSRFLWIGTESGIVRYNGFSFHQFGAYPNLKEITGRVQSMGMSNKGKFYLRMDNAKAFSFKENNVFPIKEYPYLKNLSDVAQFKYQINLNHSELVEEDLSLYSNLFYSKKALFYLRTNMYFVNKDTSYVIQKNKGDERGFVINDRFFTVNSKFAVTEFVKSNLNKVTSKKFGNFSELQSKQFDVKSNFKFFQDKTDGPLYLIVGNDLYNVRLEDEKIVLDLICEKIPLNETIKYLQFDELTKTIYLATDNRGVIILRPKLFKRILPNKILGSTSYYAQVVDLNNIIHVSTSEVFGNKFVTPIFEKNSFPYTYLDSKKNLYYSNGDGVYQYNLYSKSKVQITNLHQLVRGIYFKPKLQDSVLYIFKESTIAKFVNNKLVNIIHINDLPINFLIFDVIEKQVNEVYLATTDGIYIYDMTSQKMKLFYRSTNNLNFRTFHQYKDYIFTGTYGDGIYIIKNNVVKSIPMDQNKYLAYTHCFVEDKDEFWISTNKGIFNASISTLISNFENGTTIPRYSYYGKKEGIDVLELNGGCTPCAVKFNSNEISFPGIDGLIQFSPSTFSAPTIKPNLYLDFVNVTIKKQNIKKFIASLDYINKINTFPYNAESFEINLAIAGMLSKENIEIEYNLDDAENWKKIDVTDPVVKIINPAYGAHTITVRWKNIKDNVWVSYQSNININYPWYLKLYSIIGYIIILIGFIFLYTRIRTWNYLKRQAILEEEVALKTASLIKLNTSLKLRNQAKDQVLAIMNHDILTPLKYLHITANNITDLSVDSVVNHSIKQIAKTTKELEYQTANMLNWVKFQDAPNLGTKQMVDLYTLLNNLTEFIAPLYQNDNTQIINNVQKGTIVHSWQEPLRVLLYNLILNAIKSTPQGQVSIDHISTSSGFNLIVKDTGEGMSVSMANYLITGSSKDEVENLPKYKKGNGVGYQIIRSLISLMGAKLLINTQDQKGTEVIMQF